MGRNSVKVKTKPSAISAYILFSILFTVPVVIVLSNSDFNGISEVFSNPRYTKIMFFTVFEALISTAISLLIGLPGAFILAETKFKGKTFVRTIYSIPIVIPSIIVVLSFVVFYGNSGLLNKALMAVFNLKDPPLKILYSFKAIILAHVFYNAPLFAVLISDGIVNIDSSSSAAARCDGANTALIRCRIIVPQLIPNILSSSCLVFLYCFTSFAIVLILGGGSVFSTTEVEIYRLAKISLDIKKACSLSIFSVFVAFSVLGVQSYFQKKSTVTQVEVKHPDLRRTNCFEKLYLLITVLFLVLPIASLFVRSFFTPASRAGGSFFSAAAYSSLDIRCIIRTVIIGLISSVLGTILGYIISTDINKNKSVFRSVYSMLPMAVSSVILGLSYFIISKILNFISQSVLLILCHTVLVIPFSIRSILPSLQGLPETYREEARLEGVGEFCYSLKVLLPLTFNSVVSSLIFGFTISCGELNSTLLIASGSFETIPILINRQIGSYNFQGACANAVILILVCFILFYTGNRIKEHQTDSF